jgi:hypothetical protein
VIRRGIRAAVFLLAVLGTFAAAAADKREVLPVSLPQLRLGVAEMQVLAAYTPPTDRAHVERSVPFAPTTALEIWAKTHVEAKGQRGTALLLIRQASIVAVPLKEKVDTFRDWFRRQPVERFDGVLELELQIRDDGGNLHARLTTRATHSRHLMDDSRDRPNARIHELQTLTDEIIAAALIQLDSELRASLPQWVR